MNLENKIKNIFDTICKNQEDYTGEELKKIIDSVLELEEIETNEEALLNIEKIAKERVSGLSQEQIVKAKKSDQKWLVMSGLAYERIVLKESNLKLKDENIKIVNPNELKILISISKIKNNEKDLVFLSNWIKGETFDLFILKKVKKGFVVFGVIQCKKSIRERVSRDREPSIGAMEKGFFSILIAMNGEGLGKTNNTKSRQMINGNGNHFKKRGWHSAYFENLPFENGFIFNKNRLIEDILKNSSLFKNK